MYKQGNKNNKRSFAKPTVQKKNKERQGGGAGGFVDNRSEVVTQRKLQLLANASSELLYDHNMGFNIQKVAAATAQNDIANVLQARFYEDNGDSREPIWHWGPVVNMLWKKKLRNDQQVIFKGYGVWERKRDEATGKTLAYTDFLKSQALKIVAASPKIILGYFILSALESIPGAVAQEIIINNNATDITSLTAFNSDVDLGASLVGLAFTNTTFLAYMVQQYAMTRISDNETIIALNDPLREFIGAPLFESHFANFDVVSVASPGISVLGKGSESIDELASRIGAECDISPERVSFVLARFNVDGDKTAFVSESYPELVNYVKKVFGVKFQGKASMPSLDLNTPTQLVEGIRTRLGGVTWKHLNKEKLLDEYKDKESEVLAAITEIEIHLNRRSYFNEEDSNSIGNPRAWIDDMMNGKPFESTPTTNSKGELQWDNKQKKMPKELNAPEVTKTISNDDVQKIFSLLQSQMPGKDANNGCFARADFTAYYMNVLRGFGGVGKIRVDVKSGASDLKPTAETYLDGVEGVLWGMHTASTIKTKEGATFVMDISLKQPLSPSAWISGLTSLSAEELTISNTDQWDYHLGDNKPHGVSFFELMDQLRGLHISEMYGKRDDAGRLLPHGTWGNQKLAFSAVDSVPKEKIYVLKADTERHKERGIFRGEELQASHNLSSLDEYCKIEFPEQHLTFYVPKGVEKVRTTGIDGLKISKKEIEDRCQ